MENLKSKVSDLFNQYSVGAKPFLKWVGGKSQLLPVFNTHYPSELRKGKISEYIEPFLGGGAVFFDIVQNFNIKSVKLFDINPELILAYKVVQKNVQELIEFLERYTNEYLKLSPKNRREYFYEFRKNFNHQRLNLDFKKYNENWIPRAAQMIFINKTCFNGLYRVNSKGEFNTPSGEYHNHSPRILDRDNLLKVSKVLEIADIEVNSFGVIKNKSQENTFIYFDPPYRPISKTSSFTSYSNSNFDDLQQINLSKLFRSLDRKGIKAMLSNSDPKNENSKDNFFENLYSGYNIIKVQASRMVNSNGNKRGQINELLIKNYN